MSPYFPKPCKPFGGDINVSVDLSNYATKRDLEKATGIDKIASLKGKIDNIDVNKLNTAPVDLNILSNVVNNEVVKKIMYDKIVTKVNNIDISGFVLKTKYDTDKSNLEKN